MFRFFLLLVILIVSVHSAVSQNTDSIIEGYVYDRFTGYALPRANIAVGESDIGAAADRNGYYRFSLPPGVYTFTFRFIGYESVVAEIVLPPDTTLRRDFYLTESSIVLEGVTVSAQYPFIDPEPVALTRNIHVGEIERLSGMLADPQRAVHILTGVASNNELSAEYYIRGGNADENLILIDNFPVADPYYFTYDPRTSIGILNASLVERVQMIQGLYPSRYGNALTSALRMTTLTRTEERTTARVGLSLMQASAMVEGKVGTDVSHAAAIRSSMPSHRIGLSHPFTDTEAWMYDLQGVVQYNSAEYGRHRVFYLAGSDTFSGDYAGGSDNVLFTASSQYHAGSRTALRLFSGLQHRDFTLRSRFAEAIETRYTRYAARIEIERSVTDRVSATGGIAVTGMPVDHERRVEGGIVERFDGSLNTYSVFGEAQVRLIPDLMVIPSIRLDYFSILEQTAASGGISLRRRMNDRWMLHAGVGHYVQPPAYRGIATAAALGAADRLSVQRSTNYSVGADGRLEQNASVRVEVFYHVLDDIMIQSDVRGDRREYSGYNDGSAFARGFDFEFRVEDGRVKSWIGITMMQAHETDHRLERGPYQRTNSQTFTVNMAFEYYLGAGFTGNLRAVYGRGFYYGGEDRDKFPEYRRIDLRFSKEFKSGRVFLDMMNVWGVRNVAGGSNGFVPDWELGLPRMLNIGAEIRI